MSEQILPTPIALRDLIVDSENPRLIDSATDERAAILGMLQNQGPKLIALAEHLAEHGLSPIELTLVFPAEEGKFIVAEGNRRTAALKILHDPSLIQGGDPKLVKKLIAIAATAKSLPTSVLCVLLQSEAERVMWVKLRHTGENQGRGLSEWSAKEQTRFMARHNQERTIRMEFGLHVVELVRSRCTLTPDEEAALRVIPITTLERMLGDPAVRIALGIDRSGDGVKIIVDDEQGVLNALKDLVLEIAGKKVKVGKLMSKTDREARVAEWPAARKPGLTAEPATPRLMRLDATIAPAPPTPPPPAKAGARYSMPRSPDNRKVLIPPSVTFKITDQKIRRIFIELKKLPVEGFENAAAVLLRVFLELSIEAFLAANKIRFGAFETLRKKMEMVAACWEANQILNRNQLIGWRKSASTHDLFSVGVLHSYIHSKHSIPTKRELLRTWDGMQLYFTKLWP